MTPEAVIDRYLEFASRDPVDADALAMLLGTDADLLSRWLLLLSCPAEPEAFAASVAGLSNEQFHDFATSQALSVLSISGSVRLSFDQWQSVLRNSLVAELLAVELELADPVSVRWRVLLASSGVRLPHDPLLTELLAFRGARADLLEDASPIHRLFAVVESLDLSDPLAAQDVARQLLGLSPERFQEVQNLADRRCEEVLERLALAGEPDIDAPERLWLRLQISLLGRLFRQGGGRRALLATHELVTRRLFGRVPSLLLADETEQALLPATGEGPRIALSSRSSALARCAREAVPIDIADRADQSVADRQVMRSLDAAEALAQPLTDGTGSVRGVLLFPRDDDVDQDVAMSLYAQELGRHLAPGRPERRGDADELARYRQREEKRLREIVHEVNNPLSIVNNYLHILELKLAHEPQVVEQLRLIGDELRRAGEIIGRARELPDAEERPEAGIEAQAVDVNDLARRVVELHLGYAGEHRVSLGESLVPGQLVVHSDEHRLAQILNNLVRNAIEAAAGATVTVSTASGVFREGREGVMLSVADTGPGLPREVLARLAEPKDSSKGGDHAGLGLHIVHRLVGELDGSIDVRTSPGQGTTFSIFLPLEPGTA